MAESYIAITRLALLCAAQSWSDLLVQAVNVVTTMV